MRRPRSFALAVSLAVASFIQPTTLAAQSLSEVQGDPSIQRAIDRGGMMYRFDRAAWVTSDDLMSRLPQNRQTEVGGWIVTPAATGVHVDYFGKGAAADRAIYSADVIGSSISNATVHPADAEPPLTQLASQMVNALRDAQAEVQRHPDWRPCGSAPFNTIVLPPQADGTTPVYFLTPQTEQGSYPFGGHYEVDVAGDGRISSTRAFTRSCIALGEPQPGDKGAPAGVFITHLLDPHPTEIHVFEQHYVGIPVYVATTNPQTVWKVADDKIEKLTSNPTGAAAPSPAPKPTRQMYIGGGFDVPATAHLVGIKATGAQSALDGLQAFTNKSGFPNQQADGADGKELLIAFPPGSDSAAVTRFVDALRANSFATLKFQSIIVPAE